MAHRAYSALMIRWVNTQLVQDVVIAILPIIAGLAIKIILLNAPHASQITTCLLDQIHA